MIRFRDWGDVNARARGLEGRLLGRERLLSLTETSDLRALAHAMRPHERTGAVAPDGAAVERLSRRRYGTRLALLARWAGPRLSALRAVFGEEERQSVRALVRGALQGTDAQTRLSGLVATPALPEPALAAASRASTVDGVIAALADVEHPWTGTLRATVEEGPFDAFDLERALDRRFAGEALAAARRGGPRLVEYARQAIDIRNAWLVLGGRRGSPSRDDAWVPGGGAFDPPAFSDAIVIDDPGARRARLADVLGPTLPGPVLADPSIALPRIEAAVHRARILHWERVALSEPLSPAPLLVYVLRARAEAADLRRIAWGLELGAGRDTLAQGLVTPP